MITDFLKTSRSTKQLKVALEVLREFKKCESAEEWAEIPFFAWAKLEQLEEFLAHLAEGAPLAADTLRYMNRGAAAAAMTKDGGVLRKGNVR